MLPQHTLIFVGCQFPSTKGQKPFDGYKWKDARLTSETARNFPKDCNIGVALGKTAMVLLIWTLIVLRLESLPINSFHICRVSEENPHLSGIKFCIAPMPEKRSNLS